MGFDLSAIISLWVIPVVEKPEIVQAKEKKLKNLGNKFLVINFFQKSKMEQNLERSRKCEANGSGTLFKCGVAKHLKESIHGCKVSGNERYLCSYL